MDNLQQRWLDLGTLSAQGWWALVFLGPACSGVVYLFWHEALDRITATQAGIFLYFGPLVIAVMARPTLGETMTGVIALGGAVIFLGVWLVAQR